MHWNTYEEVLKFKLDYSILKAADKGCPGSSEHGLSFFDNRAS